MIRLSGKPLLHFLLFSGKKSTNYLWRCPSLAFSRAQFHGGLLPAINMICPPLLLLSLLLASNHTRLRVPFRSGAFGNEGGGGTGGQQTEGARLGQIYRSPTKEPFSGPQIFPSCGGRKRALFWADPSIKYGAVFGGESFRTCRTLRCCIFAFHIRFTSCILKG